jgi:hypothetical protein
MFRHFYSLILFNILSGISVLGYNSLKRGGLHVLSTPAASLFADFAMRCDGCGAILAEEQF